MKITFLNVSTAEQDHIKESLLGHEIAFVNESLDGQNVSLRETEILSVFIDTHVSAEVVRAMPKLKLIATRSTGFDHIDLDTVKKQGVVVANVPTYGVHTVAEFSFALILALSRKASAAHERLRRSGDTDIGYFEGFELFGKTLGIVGTGNIGKNTARIGKGFGMRVLLSDVYPNEAFAEEIESAYVSLEKLVAESDFVSLHVPYMKATHHLVNESLLEKFKKGSYLINTARGSVVDSRALVKALQNGTLAGAGLDVIEGEEDFRADVSKPPVEGTDTGELRSILIAHELLDMENVIITPHIAFNTKEAKAEILNTTLDNIVSFIEGKPRNNVAI